MGMSENDWNEFAGLLSKIMAIPGTWNDKRNELVARSLEFDFNTNLGELVDWFEGTVPDEK